MADGAVVGLVAEGRTNDVLGFIVRLPHAARARVVTRAVRDGPEGRQHNQSDQAGRSAKPGQSHTHVSD